VSDARAVVRAHLLWNMHKLTAGMPVLDYDVRLWYASQRLTAFDMVLLDRVEEEDLALLNACLLLEHELREQAEDTLERLLALVSGGEGTLQERVIALPEREQAAALVCLYELGWVYGDQPEGFQQPC
jgi:hypothetical protein